MDDTKKTGPRDVFLHLLAMVGLYVSVVSFGAIIFDFIDIYVPDILQNYGLYAKESLRWPLAVLVIVFPLYVWLSYYLEKDAALHPEKRELKTRKWLLYFTLFVTAIVIVGDLIALIYQFLNGELTSHFVLKVLTVLFISAAVFLYYGWNLKKDIPAHRHPTMKLFVWGVVALVVVSIVFGFYVAGSPQSQRLRRIDDQRTNDLQMIQSEIITFWQAKQKLPQNLDELRDPIRGFVPPADPETGTPYEYRVASERSFELCATFKTTSSDDSSTPKAVPMYDRYGTAQNWSHDTGHACFTRTIDPQLYPPRKGQ